MEILIVVSLLTSIGVLLALKRFWLSLVVAVAASTLLVGVVPPVVLTHPVIPPGPGYFPMIALVSFGCFSFVWSLRVLCLRLASNRHAR